MSEAAEIKYPGYKKPKPIVDVKRNGKRPRYYIKRVKEIRKSIRSL